MLKKLKNLVTSTLAFIGVCAILVYSVDRQYTKTHYDCSMVDDPRMPEVVREDCKKKKEKLIWI